MSDAGHDQEQDQPLTDADRLILAESYIDDRNRFIEKLRADLARVEAERQREHDIRCKIAGELETTREMLARVEAERDAMKAQFKNVGVVPYLDRMNQLAAQRDEARRMVVSGDGAISALQYERDAARAVLRQIQWASWEYSTGWNKCPVCHGWKPFAGGEDDRMTSGHRPDCKLAAALAEGEE
jgi:hypothetical protein